MSMGSLRGNGAFTKNNIFSLETELNYLKPNRMRKRSWSELTKLKGTVLQQQHNERTVRDTVTSQAHKHTHIHTDTHAQTHTHTQSPSSIQFERDLSSR